MKLTSLFMRNKGPGGRSGRRRRESGKAEVTAHPAGVWLVRILCLVLLWAGTIAFLALRASYQPHFQYVAGQMADRFVYCETAFEYEDPDTTAQQRREAAAQVPGIFTINAAVGEEALRRLLELNDLVRATSGDEAVGPVPPASRPAETAGAVGIAAAPALVAGLAAPQRAAFEYLAAVPARLKLLERYLGDAYRRGIISDEGLKSRLDGMAVREKLTLVDSYGRRSTITLSELLVPERAAKQVTQDFVQASPEHANATEDLLTSLLPKLFVPNLVLDMEGTQRARREASESIRVVRRTVPVGTALVRRGEVVTRDDLFRLRKYEAVLGQEVTLQADWGTRVAVAVLLLVVLAAAFHMLHAINPEVLMSNTLLTLTVTVLLVQLTLSRLAGELYSNYSNAGPAWLGVFLPLSFGAMLLAQLIGLRAAVWAGMVAAAAVALRYDQSLHLFLLGSLSSFAAALLMRRSTKRYHALRTGLGVGLVIALVSAVKLQESHMPVSFFVWLVPLAVGTGVVTAIVAAAVTPLFEYLFDVVTDLSLLELSDLNHPLLKQLQMEAPGTYHHSLIVATIAESAAAAIGANPLLARVSAYFHDIGKLENPGYFTENAMGQDMHEDLQPRMSTLVIMNHVKAGLELAAKYKLKSPLRAAIAQHHGTNLVYYFYRRAVARQQAADPERLVGEHEYRYPGPLPERKEIVIISIVDSCEAAVRSLEKATPQKIEALVEEMVLKRLRDGQFDAADLTLHELASVKATIIKSLATMHHGRVRYPREGEDDNDGDLFKSGGGPANPKPAGTDSSAGTGSR